jgi:hypothetical protein
MAARVPSSPVALRRSVFTVLLTVIALAAIVGHVCALPGHAEAIAHGGGHHDGSPVTDDHAGDDALHAASCEALRPAAVAPALPTAAAAPSRITATVPSRPVRARAVDAVARAAPPPLYLTHHALLI